jgi:hypothetical protein
MTLDERGADKLRTRSGVKENVRRPSMDGAVHRQHTLWMYELRRTVQTNSIEMQGRRFVAVIVVVFDRDAVVTVVDVVDVVDIVDIIVRLKMNKVIADSKWYV